MLKLFEMHSIKCFMLVLFFMLDKISLALIVKWLLYSFSRERNWVLLRVCKALTEVVFKIPILIMKPIYKYRLYMSREKLIFLKKYNYE